VQNWHDLCNEPQNLSVASFTDHYYRHELIAHPSGTTVKVVNLFSTLPVRRLNAEKNATGNIAKIRKCLISYALSRPSLRMYFRVLKYASSKFNFTYAPSPTDPNVRDVVRQLLNRDCAAQCLWSSETIGGHQFQALHPKANSDISTACGYGHFIFIDSRPMSTGRGIFKTIHQLFMSNIRAHHTFCRDIKDPFLVLNIIVPRGTYDANVEPSKDNFVFENPEQLIENAGRFFSMLYPVARPPAIETKSDDDESLLSTPTRLSRQVDETSNDNSMRESHMTIFMSSPTQPGHNLVSTPSRSLAVVSSSVTPSSVQLVPSAGFSSTFLVRPGGKFSENFGDNMFESSDEDVEKNQPTSNPLEGMEYDELPEDQSLKISNPWIMAKMNTPIPKNKNDRALEAPSTGTTGRTGNGSASETLSTNPGPIHNQAVVRTSENTRLDMGKALKEHRSRPWVPMSDESELELRLKGKASQSAKHRNTRIQRRNNGTQRLRRDNAHNPDGEWPELSTPPNNHDIRDMLSRRTGRAEIPPHTPQRRSTRNMSMFSTSIPTRRQGETENYVNRVASTMVERLQVEISPRRHDFSALKSLDSPTALSKSGGRQRPMVSETRSIATMEAQDGVVKGLEQFFAQTSSQRNKRNNVHSTANGQASRRRSVRRMMSVVPKGDETQNLVTKLEISTVEVAKLTGLLNSTVGRADWSILEEGCTDDARQACSSMAPIWAVCIWRMVQDHVRMSDTPGNVIKSLERGLKDASSMQNE